MNQTQIGVFIAKQRAELGMTQKELAAKLNLTDKAVSKWERGAGMPDISTLTALAEALNVRVDELLAGECFDKETQQQNASVAKGVAVYADTAKKQSVKRTALIIAAAVLIFLLCTLTLFQIAGEGPSFSGIAVRITASRFLSAAARQDYTLVESLMLPYSPLYNSAFFGKEAENPNPELVPAKTNTDYADLLRDFHKSGLEFTFRFNRYAYPFISDYMIEITYGEETAYLYAAISASHGEVTGINWTYPAGGELSDPEVWAMVLRLFSY